MKELSIENKIQFKLIELKKGEEYEVNGNEIITVISGNIFQEEKGNLETFESTVYHFGKIQSIEDTLLSVFKIKEQDIILNKINVEEEFGEYCKKNWSQLRKLYDIEGFEKINLYRSGKIKKEFKNIKYEFNLWYCGKKESCGWHNQHNFIEIHTNIAGDGFMQKSTNDNEKGLFETVGLMPGNSHRRFNINGKTEKKGNLKYPFHRWLGGNTGNIWLAIEKY